MNNHLLTVDELANELKVPKSWVYSRTRYTGPGAMPRLKIGKYIRFRLEEVLAWLESKQEDSCRHGD